MAALNLMIAGGELDTGPGAREPLACEHRQVVYRVLPGTPSRARRLASIAGACRFVWNEMLDQPEQLHVAARTCGGRAPSPTWFTLGKGFTQLRAATPWLEEMPFAPVRYVLKYQADAWKRFFEGSAGRPRFKSRGADSVTIPDHVRIVDGRLWFPKLGWLELRRRGGNPYPDARPVQAVVKRVVRRWLATVCYEVEAVKRPDDGRVVGVDRNAGQVAVADGVTARLVPGPSQDRLEARRKRYQRRMARQRRGSNRRNRTRRRLAKTGRELANRRKNWGHHVSREFGSSTVVLEDLKTRSMTSSAKGTVEAPGTNVRAKAGLTRVVLATGWAALEQMLRYKAPRVVLVPAHHTSQTCNACGHVDADSRRSQALFRCTACGHHDHADLNAARNIRRRGLAQLHGEERFAPERTPATRETDRRRAA